MKKNIIFCGTPDFAAASLKTLFKHHEKGYFNLNGVITIPDKKVGRGQKTQQCAVKKTARNLNIPILEPSNLLNGKFLHKVKSLQPDLIIVIAFKKLPKILFEIPKIGTINLHASLLPKYRGAAPINWAIINGETKTGLTTFFINEKIDTGDVILQSKINIPKHWHANDLHDKLMEESSDIIIRTIDKVFSNNYNLKPQPKLEKKIRIPKFAIARKIEKKDRIFNPKDFQGNFGVKKAYDFIRGMSPPGVKINIEIQKKDKSVKNQTILITRVNNYHNSKTALKADNNQELNKEKNTSKLNALTMQKKDKLLIITNLYFGTSFRVEKIKPENGREMLDTEFINGFLNTNYKAIRIVGSNQIF